ncbi:hypothetical protein EDC01DRAFT_632571 [Geopyxis carbonaria]|nr:hypothetical protein EDC01DRAFT_632571 [Geopyxis carbonaria]
MPAPDRNGAGSVTGGGWFKIWHDGVAFGWGCLDRFGTNNQMAFTRSHGSNQEFRWLHYQLRGGSHDSRDREAKPKPSGLGSPERPNGTFDGLRYLCTAPEGTMFLRAEVEWLDELHLSCWHWCVSSPSSSGWARSSVFDQAAGGWDGVRGPVPRQFTDGLFHSPSAARGLLVGNFTVPFPGMGLCGRTLRTEYLLQVFCSSPGSGEFADPRTFGEGISRYLDHHGVPEVTLSAGAVSSHMLLKTPPSLGYMGGLPTLTMIRSGAEYWG